ncbi:helix-turn-helix domain-containing protein [Mumia zhuanghuii]|uniref:GlxA family transcriptional regulator n=2 Tax=Mumia TaxID=1546255 RepID=A0ABW1QIM9_9ACTN|nr:MULTISPECIES: helix-turn-helix domain-containing protein [Mumia]KAA1424688.1 helix-turn-helix domain-containing protein [Mumia zhuanghuii]
MIRTVSVLVPENFHLFELGIASEVFGIDRTDDGVPLLSFTICGPEAGRPVPIAGGGALLVEHGYEDGVEADLVVVVPAAPPSGHWHEHADAAVPQAIRKAHENGAIILTLCTGVFQVAAAGLLSGKRVSTHWKHAEALRAFHPEITVDEDVLFVDEGDIVTSAGTAAGVDAALHLVRRELGSAAANAIARRMVVPPQRDGGQRQFIVQPVPDCDDDMFAEVLDWMVEHLDEQQPVARLAELAGMSTRTFARRFAAETGTTPVQWLVQQRVLRARALLETTEIDVDHVAHRCGFSSGTLLRHHFRRIVGVTPGEYRKTFSLA